MSNILCSGRVLTNRKLSLAVTALWQHSTGQKLLYAYKRMAGLHFVPTGAP